MDDVRIEQGSVMRMTNLPRANGGLAQSSGARRKGIVRGRGWTVRVQADLCVGGSSVAWFVFPASSAIDAVDGAAMMMMHRDGSVPPSPRDGSGGTSSANKMSAVDVSPRGSPRCPTVGEGTRASGRSLDFGGDVRTRRANERGKRGEHGVGASWTGRVEWTCLEDELVHTVAEGGTVHRSLAEGSPSSESKRPADSMKKKKKKRRSAAAAGAAEVQMRLAFCFFGCTRRRSSEPRCATGKFGEGRSLRHAPSLDATTTLRLRASESRSGHLHLTPS